jgi:hypothetical protein
MRVAGKILATTCSKLEFSQIITPGPLIEIPLPMPTAIRATPVIFHALPDDLGACAMIYTLVSK